MKRPERLALCLAALLVLGGCSQPAPGDGATSAPTSVAAPTSTSAAVEGDSEPEHVAEPAPSPAAEDSASAIAAAELAVELFARPGIDRAVWLDELMPHLSQTAAPLFATIDPVSITATARTGAGSLLPDPSEYVVLVTVPTDAGVLAVSLSRTATDVPWLVDRIRPVEG